MSIPRFFSRQTLSAHTDLLLDPQCSGHISRVLRMRVGDELCLFDGRGGEYRAEILTLTKKGVTVRVGAHQALERESPLQLHLSIGMSRGERMDWVIQKATELGVNTITPLVTERCGLKLSGERRDKKLKHWQEVAISACEQCGRNRIPTVKPPITLTQSLANSSADLTLVLHHRATPLPASDAAPGSVALLVGPEGGLSPSEIEMAEAAGCQAMALGPRVLRTETAPLAALALLQSRWGDMPAP